MKERRITIAGGGVAGLSAGINLARAGYQVDVFERKKEAGGRFYGDLQGIENWTTEEEVITALAKMNIELNFEYTPLRQLLLSDAKKTTRNVCFERPMCYLVKRGTMPGSLDQGLKAQALRQGVHTHFGQTIDPAQADIMATGPVSRETFAVDKGIAFETSLPDMAIGIVNDEAAVKGYAYLLVTNSYGCLCTVIFDHFSLLDQCFERAQEIIGNMVPLDIRNPERVGGLGCFSLQNTFRNGNALVTGEAAGLQDILWGFGIRSAIESGYMAAQSIIHGYDYEQQAQQYFSGKLKASVVNRFLYEKIGKHAYSFLIRCATRSEQPIRFLYDSHRFTRFHRWLYPLALSSMQKTYPKLKLKNTTL